MNWLFDFMAARSQFELVAILIFLLLSPAIYVPVIFSMDRWIPPTLRFVRRIAVRFWESFYYWHIGDRT